ncbi:MAG: NAD-dependent succinate-semialdehyde dehydrogenase [Pigmentiphaga sp.]|nr:NAD-dependent succinate-semialdehyde dehydrogenase [Pigmentiphaga sp.]
MQYRELQLLIGGQWIGGDSRETIAVVNPSTGQALGRLPVATEQDVDDAVEAASLAFAEWSARSAYERAIILRRAAQLLRERAPRIAELICLEQGKPLADAQGEARGLADIAEWDADEGRRVYGRTIPSRTANHTLATVRVPMGPVAAFTPWNYPALLPLRKISAILAAGCSCILKPAEETPASALEIVQAYLDAGLPPGLINVVHGAPARTSARLIANPAVRGITFTGSTEVGRTLAGLCGQHLKKSVMELGGHAPVIIMDDAADIEALATATAHRKFKNASQGCVNPGRFFVHEKVFDRFVEAFVNKTRTLRVGNAVDAHVDVGPLLHERRVQAMRELTEDAVARGARLLCGGQAPDLPGFFWQPTVLADVPTEARVLNEEIFGPVVPFSRFSNLETVLAEANRLPYGLAAYAFTQSLENARYLERRLQAGMIGLNTFSLGVPDSISSPETPFGGIKCSGFGSEGGSEGLESFLDLKLVSEYAKA